LPLHKGGVRGQRPETGATPMTARLKAASATIMLKNGCRSALVANHAPKTSLFEVPYSEIGRPSIEEPAGHGTFSRADFTFDKDRNLYICPKGKLLTTTGRVHDGKTILCRARTRTAAYARSNPSALRT